MFLVIFSQIWHAAVDRSQTWVWWASGIVLGVAILTLFALFEKRRDDVVKMIEDIKRSRETEQSFGHKVERDAGGNRTHFDRVAAGCLAIWLQRQVSSSGVEPDPRPSQGRVRSATLRG